jgi:proteic killer suppression protein
VIVSIKHKGLKLLWEKNDSSKLPAAQVKKIRNILTMLDAAQVAEDMNYPGAKFHGLKGDLAGHYSITVTGNYRITFRFENGDAELVDYQDYHWVKEVNEKKRECHAKKGNAPSTSGQHTKGNVS